MQLWCLHAHKSIIMYKSVENTKNSIFTLNVHFQWWYIAPNVERKQLLAIYLIFFCMNKVNIYFRMKKKKELVKWTYSSVHINTHLPLSAIRLPPCWVGEHGIHFKLKPTDLCYAFLVSFILWCGDGVCMVCGRAQGIYT